MKYYELAKLNTALGAAATVAPRIEEYVKDDKAGGRLAGAWFTDIGALNNIFILREFDSREEMLEERMRTRASENPFGCVEHLNSIEIDGYMALDFMPPVPTGEHGPIYEIRTYVMKHNGLKPTLEAWRAAVPKRLEYSGLSVAMFSTDGEPRFTHIWPYKSLEERSKIRAKTVADGIWPPKGGPQWLTPNMVSTIGLPLGFSPLK